MIYKRQQAVDYALRYALHPNPSYVYFQGNDCTNFISQCLRAGGAYNDYNESHPWWYDNGKASICWAVAHSLYWYIMISSEENIKGIRAKSYHINAMNQYSTKIAGKVEVGDLIQYKNEQDRIQHSTIITGFDPITKEPLVCQHTFEGRNISWRKNFKQYIFHHITGINNVD